MPHISKRKLEDKHLDNLYNELVLTLDRGSKKIKTKQVLNQLLTKTEKVMFSKRLAIIAMLSKEIPVYDIANALNMSPATVSRMSVRFENNKYDLIIKEGLGKKDIWQIIEEILTTGGSLPFKTDKNRWRGLQRSVHNQKLKIG
jgi:Trp operon repressor